MEFVNGRIYFFQLAWRLFTGGTIGDIANPEFSRTPPTKGLVAVQYDSNIILEEAFGYQFIMSWVL